MRACGSPKDPAKGITDGKRGKEGTFYTIPRLASCPSASPLARRFFSFLFVCDEVA